MVEERYETHNSLLGVVPSKDNNVPIRLPIYSVLTMQDWKLQDFYGGLSRSSAESDVFTNGVEVRAPHKVRTLKMGEKVESDFSHSSENDVVENSFTESLNFVTGSLQRSTFLENNSHFDKFASQSLNGAILANDLGIGVSAILFPPTGDIQFLFKEPSPLGLAVFAKCDLRKRVSE